MILKSRLARIWSATDRKPAPAQAGSVLALVGGGVRDPALVWVAEHREPTPVGPGKKALIKHGVPWRG